MRLIVQFERLREIRFISQLDLLRSIHRALRRAEIPVAYSEGFNPQPKVSFGFALPVGLVSHGEYMDIALKEAMSADEFLKKICPVMPEGMKILSAAGVDDRAPKMGKMIDCARFETKIFSDDPDLLLEKAESFFAMDEMPMERHSKKGTSFINVRPYVYFFEAKKEKDGIILTTVQALSEEMSIRIDDLIKAFLSFTGETELKYYAEKDDTLLRYEGKFVTPVEFARNAERN